MKKVFQTILDNIWDQKTCFVFPSEIAAVTWARKILICGGIRSIASDRFLAWDRFKESAVRVREKDKKPVSALIRRLFALSLARKNAAAPFLLSIIPPSFAENGAVFVKSIAMMLPSLSLWEELQAKRASPKDDEEDRDLAIIKVEYTAFLEDHGLFEPAWEKMPFQGTDRRYIIFFPEVLDDFAEYRDLFNFDAIVACSAEADEPEQSGPKQTLQFFDSARQEIRTALTELRRLHEEEGLPYEDMALSLPGYKSMEPYLSRELALRDIPFSRRAGKNLGEYPAGRLFSLVSECAASLFSFDALKPLLLNNSIPWKESEKNRALISFGIRNHCVSPFRDRGHTADAWEEGFKQDPDEDLAAYYGKLKQSLSALCSAKSFKEIRENYFTLRVFFDMKKCSPESNAVLARCIEELSVLIEAEEEFPGLVDEDPFGFYVSHLAEKNYVYAQNPSTGGINIYDYPVAAGSPFGCHMVLNVSQAAAKVQRRPLSFLREDKRAKLGIEDVDVSQQMIRLFSLSSWKGYSCHTRISASERTFSGWAIPHSVFALSNEHRGAEQTQAEPELSGAADDPFLAERRWWTRRGGKPQRLFSVQQRGFDSWSSILLGKDTENAAADTTAFSAVVSALLRERIRNKNAGDPASPAAAVAVPALSVSATDLTVFFKCPVSWLYRSIFHLESYQEDAALLDDESKGLIYHEILRRLFARIRENDKKFLPGHFDIYCGWIEEITGKVLRSNDTLRGPLVYPLLLPLGESINKRLRALLKTEARYFAEFEVSELEQKYELSQDGLHLNGRIDRVSMSSQGPVIIDYKTNIVPGRMRSRMNSVPRPGTKERKDFQIPMYVKLYEELKAVKVDRAFFISINKNTIEPVMGELEGRQSLCSREDYQSTLDALDSAITYFGKAALALDFALVKIPYSSCVSCEFKTLCRSLYALNRRPDVYNRHALPDGEDDVDGYIEEDDSVF